MPTTRTRDEMLGLTELAELCSVKQRTAFQWNYRALLPEPDARIGGRPAWYRSRLIRWARQTGRVGPE